MIPFDTCVELKESGGRFDASCRLGLWSVNGSDKRMVMREAAHYFIQYLSDGEYDALIEEAKLNQKS